MSQKKVTRVRQLSVTILFMVGLLLTTIALAADFLGLDLTPGFGVVQMVPFLLGITCLTLAIFLYVYNTRRHKAPRSLQADISLRLAATGLVLVYVSGMSDLIGIGTHTQPNFERPFVGPLQLGGMALGGLLLLVGLYLYATSRGPHQSSSMDFLQNDAL